MDEYEIPKEAEKILFAENFMDFIMFRMNSVKYVSLGFEQWRFKPYIDFVYNAFNESVQSAIRFLDKTMEMHHDDIFFYMQNANVVNEETFNAIGRSLAEKYLPKGFDSNNFLHYCLHLTTLAVYFYNNGVSLAPDLAVMYIIHAFRDIDMTTGGWETLTRTAEQYASLERDSTNIESPPESPNPDEGSHANAPTQNAAEIQSNEDDGKGGSNILTGEGKPSCLVANEKISSPLKHPSSEKRPPYVPKKLSKRNQESKDISGFSEMSQSTSSNHGVHAISKASFKNESKLKDNLDSRSLEIKHPVQSNSSSVQNNLGQIEQSSLEEQMPTVDSEENSQPSSSKFKPISFDKHYSPTSSDDENSFSQKGADPSLS